MADALAESKKNVKRDLHNSKRELNRMDTNQMSPLYTKSTLNAEQCATLESMVHTYKVELDRFAELKHKFMSLMDEEDEDFEAEENKICDDLTSVSGVYHRTIAKVATQKMKLAADQARGFIVPSVGSSANQSFNESNSFVPKLPKIDIPKFNGNILNFRNFKNLWENLVHNRTELTGVQKLYFLNQAMTEKASDLIKNFELEDDGYLEAWNFLLERYDNKRLILRTLFKKLIDMETIRSPSQIRDLLDRADQIIHGLKAMGEEVDGLFSKFVAYFVSTKLDRKSFQDWENFVVSTSDAPLYVKLHSFLQNRSFSAEEASFNQSPSGSKAAPYSKPLRPTEKKSFTASLTKPTGCHACPGDHVLIECPVFAQKTSHERYRIVKSAGVCINCFGNHYTKTCNRSPCKVCKLKHHSLLHHTDKPSSSSSATVDPPLSERDNTHTRQPKVEIAEPKTCSATSHQAAHSYILLPTAVVRFECGNSHGLLRILFDCASQSTAISDAFVDKYKLKTYLSSSVIDGVGGQLTSAHSCSLTLKSRLSSFAIQIQADVLPSTSMKYKVPADFSFISKQALASLKLADEGLNYRTIDLILGNEYYDQCVLDSKLTFNEVIFKETRFGWVPTGPLPTNLVCKASFCFVSTREIHDSIKRFWESEESLKDDIADPEHKMCERHFENTFRQNEEGRFVIRLPFKGSLELLGESRSRALRSLTYRESKLKPEIRIQYVQFMAEYLELNHMSPIRASDRADSNPTYYINHHAVLRPSSTTTKLRVVFNASAPTAGGPSLNQLMMRGPKVQSDLFDILLTFRTYKIAFSADIQKMYRQILVDEADRNLQRILWRSDPAKPVQEFTLNTLTYGTAPASFIAQKCLSVVADSIDEKFPVAALSIRNCFYMDDLLCGGSSVEEAFELQKTIHSALLAAQFPLRKYISNSTSLLKKLDQCLVEKGALDFQQPESSTLILGLVWEPTADVFRINVSTQNIEISSTISKRFMLSVSSRIFDPMGFISPISIKFKRLLQQIWREKLGWDEPVPETIRKAFIDCVSDIKELRNLAICRPYSSNFAIDYELVGFCDASLHAYSAAVYMKSYNERNEIQTYLVCSKSRVAPLSSTSPKTEDTKINIHRLELMGALLLSELIVRVANRLLIRKSKIKTYSDSQVVLYWLAKPPDNWKSFVKNRVEKIQTLLPYHHWSYVRSEENPADLCTRGIAAGKLLSNSMWLNGPDFINTFNRENSSNACVLKIELSDVENSVLNTELAKCVNNIVVPVDNSLFCKSSSFFRLQCAVVRMLRWSPKNPRFRDLGARITVEELNNSFFVMVKYAQYLDFSDEINSLQRGEPLKVRSRLRFFVPFLDERGVMRVEGRLANSSVSYDQRHPIILASRNSFVRLYVTYAHEKYFHAGVSFLDAYLHSRFRFLGGVRSLLKSIVHKCVTCARFNYRTQNQLMGQLPAERTNPSRPFSVVGIDYAGPFDTKCVGHRSTIRFKSYLCVFVCFSTRAVHLEFVSSLDTSQFMSAFNRFSSRRGVPAKIFSDNGSNFIAARKVLKIVWELSPPYGPHHQGLTEAAVKAAKRALAKVTKGATLTFEEYTTLFNQIEATLNSRPLCRYKDDSYLTPGHFLTGSHLLFPDESDAKNSLLKRHQLVQKIYNDFWSAWSKDYLNSLNNLTKWLKTKSNVKVGDIALVRQPGMKPGKWPVAVVVETFPASDALVRKVVVRVHGKLYERPITELIILPIENSVESSRGTVATI